MPLCMMQLLAGLTYLSSYAVAVPPLNAPSSLTIFNANLTVPYPHNVTLGASSVSARSPNDVIFYTIPNADITMKFLNWGHVNLPGAEARAVLQLATTDCFTHGSQKYIPGGDYEFPSGDTLLEVTPRTESSEYRRPLTWILWLRAITGLKDWVRAYPGLNFAFEIYELLETESGVEEFSIGSGQLTDMH